MKVVSYESFGRATDVLISSDKALSDPVDSEVQVKLYSSGINPSDIKKRAGQRGEFADDFVIPHSDGAGVISKVGNHINDSRVGERVWLHSAQHGRHWGTASEAINIHSRLASPLSKNCSFGQGACFGIPIMTAHRCVTLGEDVNNKIVLITGAMGRVGFYAVQIAKHFGAKVIGTYGAETDKDTVLALGADYAVCHRDNDFPEQIAECLSGRLIDHVVEVEFGVNVPKYVDVLNDYATISSYASGVKPEPAIPFYALMFKNVTIKPVFVYSMPDAAIMSAISDINQLSKASSLTFHTIQEFPLSQAIQAHEHLEQGARGHTVLTIN